LLVCFVVVVVVSSGGMWLVTDMRRGESIFELDPSFQQAVEDGLHRDGSDLTGVSGSCSWEDVDGIVGVGNPTVDPQFTMLSQVTPTGLPAIPEVRKYLIVITVW
jgi:hypothetical protein